MDEQTKKRILMDNEIKAGVLLAAFRAYGEQAGMAGGSTELQGWYAGPVVKEEKLNKFAREMGDSAVSGIRLFTKMVGYSESFDCKVPMDKAFEHTLDIVSKMPSGGYNHTTARILESAIGSGEAALAAVVGSGMSDMNFAVTTVLFSVIDAGNTKVQLSAYAKESRIPFFNKRTSRKAVRRIISGIMRLQDLGEGVVKQ